MFHDARIKLTLMYTLIIMLISVAFSVFIYQALTVELDRLEIGQRKRLERLELPFPPPQGMTDQPSFLRRIVIDPELIAEAKRRLLLTLGVVNLVIVVSAAGSGYFLSGRTLQPIQQMVDKQKRFVSDASHELRTPLTSMRTEMEVALLNDLRPEESKELIHSAVQEIRHLQELVDNLLVLSNGEGDRIAKRFSNVLLLDVVDDALKKVVPKAKAKKITIENDVADETVQGDSTSLTQVMVILLDNAIKYSSENTVVKIYSQKKDTHVEITVEDQGKGIAEKNLPHVFDRFYRADETRTKSRESGYGLGLAIAKKLIELHNGKIWIESTFGVGTLVHIQIPV